jgi:hypothetical protein
VTTDLKQYLFTSASKPPNATGEGINCAYLICENVSCQAANGWNRNFERPRAGIAADGANYDKRGHFVVVLKRHDQSRSTSTLLMTEWAPKINPDTSPASSAPAFAVGIADPHLFVGWRYSAPIFIGPL